MIVKAVSGGRGALFQTKRMSDYGGDLFEGVGE